MLFWTGKPCLMAPGRFTRAIQLANDAAAVMQRDLCTTNDRYRSLKAGFLNRCTPGESIPVSVR